MKGTRIGGERRGGQVLPLVFFAVLTLLFAALWLADVHRAVNTKDKAQNAGDAAALEAARWMAATLNLEGDLNLAHAAAVAAGDEAAAEAITNAQVRALFSGPLAGVSAAQKVAKLNGTEENEEFTAFVRERAAIARHGYGARMADGTTAMPEPWEGAWDEYADMLHAIAEEGVAAGVDNAEFYDDPQGSHWLLDIGFYNAVLGRDWCWFKNNAPSLLSDYSGFGWWPPLPERRRNEAPFSPELLPLHLRPAPRIFSDLLESAPFAAAAEAAGIAADLPPPRSEVARKAPVHQWIAFDHGRWGRWTAMQDPSFPLRGRLRDEYDVAGADAAMRVENSFGALTRPGAGEKPVSWTAAAKPLGFIEYPDSPGGRETVAAAPVVLPAWNEARLIPLDASSTPSGGSFNLGWRRHCTEHLPEYMLRGKSALKSHCRWCNALFVWEDPDFRKAGAKWLTENSWKCTVSPPGGSRGGGTGHAH